MEPPVPYTADVLWKTVLLPLYGRLGEYELRTELNYADIIDEAKTQVRSWVTDSEHLVRGFVNSALSFLNDIGWAEYFGPEKPVVFYPNKGIGQGDLKELFCEKWYNSKTKQRRPISSKKEVDYLQLTFDTDEGG